MFLKTKMVNPFILLRSIRITLLITPYRFYKGCFPLFLRFLQAVYNLFTWCDNTFMKRVIMPFSFSHPKGILSPFYFTLSSLFKYIITPFRTAS